MCTNEEKRRKRIRESLLNYYQTDKGISHRRLLSELQRNRMANYARFLKENKNIKKLIL